VARKKSLSKRIIKNGEGQVSSGTNVFQQMPGDTGGRKKVTPREQLEKEAAELKRRAESDGFEAGYAKGLSEGREKGHLEGLETGRLEAIQKHEAELDLVMAQYRQELEQANVAIESALARWFQEAEVAVSDVATTIARRIMDRELELHPEQILEIVRVGIGEVRQAKGVKVRLNAPGAKILSEQLEPFLKSIQGLDRLLVVADPTITGGCIVESESGSVDATLDTVFELLEGEAA